MHSEDNKCAPTSTEDGGFEDGCFPQISDAGEAGGRSEAVSAERRPARFAGEGDTSNTPSLKTITGGEDWLTLSLYVRHGDFESLESRLNDAQRAAKHNRVSHDEILFGDGRFIVSPAGVRLGSRSKGAYYSWHLKSDIGVTILLMACESPMGDQPNASVKVPSIVLMQHSVEEIWAWVQYCFDGMGSMIVSNKLSRVDACVDLPEVNVSEFTEAFRNGWMVTRARSRTEYDLQLRSSSHYFGNKPTGFSIGKSPILIRVYDKLTESKRDPTKMALLIANRWGRLVESATRVEIELGRQKLQSFGVDTLEDWLKLRASICKFVTTQWFRLTDGPVDRQHADRSQRHPIWQHTIEQFASWCDGPSDCELIPLLKAPIDMSRMVNSALGNLIGVFARIGKNIENNRQFMREAVARLQDAIGDRNLSEEVRRRALELGS